MEICLRGIFGDGDGIQSTGGDIRNSGLGVHQPPRHRPNPIE
jgi:hypothetical protein